MLAMLMPHLNVGACIVHVSCSKLPVGRALDTPAGACMRVKPCTHVMMKWLCASGIAAAPDAAMHLYVKVSKDAAEHPEVDCLRASRMIPESGCPGAHGGHAAASEQPSPAGALLVLVGFCCCGHKELHQVMHLARVDDIISPPSWGLMAPQLEIGVHC